MKIIKETPEIRNIINEDDKERQEIWSRGKTCYIDYLGEEELEEIKFMNKYMNNSIRPRHHFPPMCKSHLPQSSQHYDYNGKPEKSKNNQ